MQKSNWREEIDLDEGLQAALGITKAVETGVKAGIGLASGAVKAVRSAGKAISGRQKTASQKRIIKTGGIKAVSYTHLTLPTIE
mgnify:CR=1 FL=1